MDKKKTRQKGLENETEKKIRYAKTLDPEELPVDQIDQ